jgi:hypothetical protein
VQHEREVEEILPDQVDGDGHLREPVVLGQNGRYRSDPEQPDRMARGCSVYIPANGIAMSSKYKTT